MSKKYKRLVNSNVKIRFEIFFSLIKTIDSVSQFSDLNHLKISKYHALLTILSVLVLVHMISFLIIQILVWRDIQEIVLVQDLRDIEIPLHKNAPLGTK